MKCLNCRFFDGDRGATRAMLIVFVGFFGIVSVLSFTLTWLSEHGVYGTVYSMLKEGLIP